MCRAGRDRRGFRRRCPHPGTRRSRGDRAFARQGCRRCRPPAPRTLEVREGPAHALGESLASSRCSQGRTQTRTARAGVCPAAIGPFRRTLASCPTLRNRRAANMPCPRPARITDSDPGIRARRRPTLAVTTGRQFWPFRPFPKIHCTACIGWPYPPQRRKDAHGAEACDPGGGGAHCEHPDRRPALCEARQAAAVPPSRGP